jgi:hypothetical protein
MGCFGLTGEIENKSSNSDSLIGNEEVLDGEDTSRQMVFSILLRGIVAQFNCRNLRRLAPSAPAGETAETNNRQ